MKVKYVKIPVIERLPEKGGNYTIVTFSKNVHYEFRYDNESEKSIELWKSIVDWFLEEVPDHSEEMLSMLEELVSLKHLKDTDGKTPYYLERQPKAWEKAKQLINKVKDNGKTLD